MLSIVENGHSFKLDELAKESGVSARTVRYYVQRGLLPAPIFKGRDTAYSTEHLIRLQAIRRLQERFLPLDAIAAELARRSPDELKQLATGREPAHHSSTTRVAQAPPPRRVETRGERWHRWELRPGLELHLSEGADAMTRALAEELRKQYGGTTR
jgi:Ca-activated chloride channel family protein